MRWDPALEGTSKRDRFARVMAVPTHGPLLGNVEKDGDPGGQHVTGRYSENRAGEGSA